jgi:hypothetical protein
MDSPKLHYSNKQPKIVKIIDRAYNPISAAEKNQFHALFISKIFQNKS